MQWSLHQDDELIILAMNLDREEKISDDNNKIILRKIAADIGVPKIAYERKKKGATYFLHYDANALSGHSILY